MANPTFEETDTPEVVPGYATRLSASLTDYAASTKTYASTKYEAVNATVVEPTYKAFESATGYVNEKVVEPVVAFGKPKVDYVTETATSSATYSYESLAAAFAKIKNALGSRDPAEPPVEAVAEEPAPQPVAAI